MRTTGWIWIILLTAAAATAFFVGAAFAQMAPDARKGLEYARAHCTACHAVEPGNQRSINPEAPAFSAIAASPGISAPALHAVLQSPHRRMPDIVLAPDDRANVVAYIIGLKPQ
jgi:mono/diheme cytochrome c family protein